MLPSCPQQDYFIDRHRINKREYVSSPSLQYMQYVSRSQIKVESGPVPKIARSANLQQYNVCRHEVDDIMERPENMTPSRKRKMAQNPWEDQEPEPLQDLQPQQNLQGKFESEQASRRKGQARTPKAPAARSPEDQARRPGASEDRTPAGRLSCLLAEARIAPKTRL